MDQNDFSVQESKPGRKARDARKVRRLRAGWAGPMPMKISAVFRVNTEDSAQTRDDREDHKRRKHNLKTQF
ncbi:MAG TPA: hypothetical protein VG269_05765 [Tepidisphaeraceae bacterium]|jgi:hypothetical protein|nr:hypothetical protein [Tepidisphaeraceae bacterium]